MPKQPLIERLSRYQRVRVEIENDLSSIAVGEKIPTEEELAKKYNVSRVTTRKALEFLRESGVLVSYPRRGTFLARRPTVSPLVGSAKLLGVLVPNLDNATIGKIVESIALQATSRGYQILINHDHGDPERQIEQLERMCEASVEGVLLYPDRFVTERSRFIQNLNSLKKKGVPLVLLDRRVSGFDFPCVMTDNERGMYEATRHLLGMGRRKPALLGFWKNNTVHRDRKAGYLRAVVEAGISSGALLDGEVGVKDFDMHAYEIVEKWLKNSRSRNQFDSIVCMTDTIAYGAFTALSLNGMRVPDDVALVGYDNLDSGLYRILGLDLTSVQQPLGEIGSRACDLLLDGIEGKKEEGTKQVLLPPKLMVRTSCGERK